MANHSTNGTAPVTRAAGTLLLALRPAFTALMVNALVVLLSGVVLVASEGMDDPWPMWGLLCGLMAFMNVLSLYPVLGKVANSVPLSRPVVVAMFLAMVGGVAVVSGVAAAVLGWFEPRPDSVGDAWWTPTLLAFAAGAWIAAWAVPMMFVGLLPLALALVAGIVLCAVAMAGVAGPMLLIAFGDESMMTLAIASPVVTLPAMAGLLFLAPLQRLAPRSR